MLGGTLRALGWQNYAAKSQIVGYYLVGVPFLITVAVYWQQEPWAVFYLWWSVVAAIAVNCIMQAIVLVYVDWDAAVEDSQRRLRKQK